MSSKSTNLSIEPNERAFFSGIAEASALIDAPLTLRSVPPRFLLRVIYEGTLFSVLDCSNVPAARIGEALAGEGVGDGVRPLRLMFAYVLSEG